MGDNEKPESCNQIREQIRNKSTGQADDLVKSDKVHRRQTDKHMFFSFFIYRRYGIPQQAPNASTASHVTEQLPIWHQVAAAEKSMYNCVYE